MTNEEKELIVYCLKANSDFHGEVCEECKNYPKCDHFQADSLMEKLIEYLEQEQCKDAVSRQAVLKTLDDIDNVLDEDRTVENYKELLKECYEVLSPVNPQKPKTGHWIRVDATHSKCDRCWAVFEITSPNGEVNYCPHCGAKMVDPPESEDK